MTTKVTGEMLEPGVLSDVDTGFTVGNFLRVKSGGGLEQRTPAQVKSDIGAVTQTITLTGDVTGSGTGTFAATISAGSVTLAKQANLAANSIIGNNTGLSGVPLALTAAQVRALISVTASESTLCRVTRAAQQNITAAVFTTIVWDTETSDPGNAYNTGTGEYTVPVTGAYSITAAAGFLGFANDSDTILGLFINGTETIRMGSTRGVNPSGNVNATQCVGGTVVVSLTAGQIITIRAYLAVVQATSTARIGANPGGSQQNFLMIHQI